MYLTTNLLRPMTKNFTNMHFLVKLLGLLADWELKWSPVFSTYLLLKSRSFLMPFAKNIFGCAQSLIHTASWGYSLFAFWHPPSAVWKSGNYIKRDLECMLHGRESQISIFLIISVVVASRRSSIVMMQTISHCQYALGWLWTADVNSPVGVVQHRQRAHCWRITEHDIANY